MKYIFDTTSSWFAFHTHNLNNHKFLYIINLEINLKSIELDDKLLKIDKKLEINFDDICEYNSKEYHDKYGTLKIHSIDMKGMTIKKIRFLLHLDFSMTNLYHQIKKYFNIKITKKEFEDELKKELEKEIFSTGTIKDVYAII